MNIQAIISLLLIWSLWSCNLDSDSSAIDENEEKESKTAMYRGNYYTNFETAKCKQQIDSAKDDIKNGNLVYQDNTAWKIIRYDDEMEEILCQYGIDYQQTGPNCTLQQECYGYYMDSVIKQRFGEDFIKRIEMRADSLFLSRWKSKTYEHWNIDKNPEFHEGDAEKFIEKRIQFPQN